MFVPLSSGSPVELVFIERGFDGSKRDLPLFLAPSSLAL